MGDVGSCTASVGEKRDSMLAAQYPSPLGCPAAPCGAIAPAETHPPWAAPGYPAPPRQLMPRLPTRSSQLSIPVPDRLSYQDHLELVFGLLRRLRAYGRSAVLVVDQAEAFVQGAPGHAAQPGQRGLAGLLYDVLDSMHCADIQARGGVVGWARGRGR